MTARNASLCHSGAGIRRAVIPATLVAAVLRRSMRQSTAPGTSMRAICEGLHPSGWNAGVPVAAPPAEVVEGSPGVPMARPVPMAGSSLASSRSRSGALTSAAFCARLLRIREHDSATRERSGL
jgi:hypothetical protein